MLSLRRVADFGDIGSFALWTLAMELQRRNNSVGDSVLILLLASLKDFPSTGRILIWS